MHVTLECKASQNYNCPKPKSFHVQIQAQSIQKMTPHK